MQSSELVMNCDTTNVTYDKKISLDKSVNNDDNKSFNGNLIDESFNCSTINKSFNDNTTDEYDTYEKTLKEQWKKKQINNKSDDDIIPLDADITGDSDEKQMTFVDKYIDAKEKQLDNDEKKLNKQTKQLTLDIILKLSQGIPLHKCFNEQLLKNNAYDTILLHLLTAQVSAREDENIQLNEQLTQLTLELIEAYEKIDELQKENIKYKVKLQLIN